MYGDTLVFTRISEGPTSGAPANVTTTSVVPTPTGWAAFWRSLEAVGVRRWARQCVDESIVDGGGFSLDITYERGRVVASGGNSYPTRDGKCMGPEASVEYLGFRAAIETLAAGGS